ncbi:hypothetical protein Taro_041081 [Colocasia esculenta]|uniref:Uncharacterized protein n=1 Tax=Colocasia esculenta TaxID=4460 RepID=A0A843WWA6_COLES|nr:hypothetical protein [Colocasia esculenta]
MPLRLWRAWLLSCLPPGLGIRFFFCISLCLLHPLPPALRPVDDMAAKSCLHSISHFLEPIRLPRPAKPRSRVRVPAPTCSSRTKPHASSSSSGEDVLFPEQRVEKKGRRGQRSPRRLITISTSDGRWHGQWNCDYVFSLGELGLADVAEGGQADTEVLVSLAIEKHSGFGFSVGGRIATCFTGRCSSCFSSYSKEINTTFKVWVLPSGRSDPLQLPEIGSNDPSVIYVKPGSEADLDSLIRDTIRLAASAKAIIRFLDMNNNTLALLYRIPARNHVRSLHQDGIVSRSASINALFFAYDPGHRWKEHLRQKVVPTSRDQECLQGCASRVDTQLAAALASSDELDLPTITKNVETFCCVTY